MLARQIAHLFSQQRIFTLMWLSYHYNLALITLLTKAFQESSMLQKMTAASAVFPPRTAKTK